MRTYTIKLNHDLSQRQLEILHQYYSESADYANDTDESKDYALIADIFEQLSTQEE